MAYYTFASVPVGDYALTAEGSGFQVYKADNIRLGGGERRNVNVTLTVGTATQTVEVSAETSSVAVVDSGEKSFTLEAKELQNFTQVAAMPPSTSRSFLVSALTMEPRTRPTTTARPSGSMPTAIPVARARSTIRSRTTDFPRIHWTSPLTARTSPILAATATCRLIPTRISFRNSRC